MILLKRMLLIHWYRFIHEMVLFKGVNFLTGQNAIGKSTLIDAMQVVMLGEPNGGFFNKAANDSSNRTLEGYLRCELGDDGADGLSYLRPGRFTSHLAMEFYDDKRKAYVTLGAVFECFETEKTQYWFYIAPLEIPSHEWIKHTKGAQVPYTWRETKQTLESDAKAYGNSGKLYFPQSNMDRLH